MTLIIVAILLIGYVLIATSSMTKINKAAAAIFAGTVGWVLYICYGSDFVMSQHPSEYIDFLGGANPTSVAVKEYISRNVFLKYVGRGAEIVLFLLATMTIVEVLNNNGCFDFLKQMMRTRKSKKLLWVMTMITFVISANLDNLTVTTMMLVMMHEIVPNRSGALDERIGDGYEFLRISGRSLSDIMAVAHLVAVTHAARADRFTVDIDALPW